MQRNYLWLLLCSILLTTAFNTTAQNCNPVITHTLTGSALQLSATIPGIPQPTGDFSWTVYNTQMGTQQNLQGQTTSTHISLSAPAHTVVVYYYDSTSGCGGIAYDTIWINRGIRNCAHTGVGFQVNHTPTQTTLSGFSTGFGPNVQYNWSTGQTGANITPNVANGWSIICLTVTDGTCSLTWCDSVYVGNMVPCMNFAASINQTVNGNTASFTASANGSGIYNYFWDFAGLGSSTAGTPSFTFPSQPNGMAYSVMLTISDAGTGCTYTTYDSVWIAGTGTGNPCSRASVQFTPNSTPTSTTLVASSTGFGPNVQYSWSTGQTGAQIPLSLPNGWHYICLTATDSTCTVQWCDSVYINNTIPCNANALNLGFNFDNYANEISWDVRDLGGNVIVSSNGTYSSVNNGRTVIEQLCLATGCYELNIYDSWGDGLCCAYGQGDYSLIDPATGNSLASGARFGSVETTQFCVGGATNPCAYLSNLSFQYILGPNGTVDLSTNFPLGSAATYSWTVTGSNGILTSTAIAPTFTLTNGLYTATLMVSDTGCQGSATQTFIVRQNNSGPNCSNIIPGMNILQDSVNPYQIYVIPTLANVSPNYSFQFAWQFGNSSYSGLPTHNFPGPGSYPVCYVATDTFYSCSVTFCDTIHLDSLGNMSRFTPGKWQAQVLPPVITYLTQTETVANSSAWNLNAFPNPAQTQITLQWETNKALEANLTILDLTGRTVHQQLLNGRGGTDAVTLDIAQLPAGVYLLRLVNDTHQETIRFIKE